MKNLAFALFSCLLFSSTRAQLRTAITGGMHMASVPANSSPGWDNLSYDYHGRNGFHAGILTDFSFSSYSPFNLQAGMYFTSKGRSFGSTLDSSGQITRVSGLQYTNYMEIPVNLVWKIKLGRKSKLLLGGGPYLSFLYSGKERKETYYSNGYVQISENTDLKIGNAQGKYQNFDYGINGLFGFEVGRFFITANYSRGYTDFYQPAGKPPATFRHEVMGGSIGFFLTNPKRKLRGPRDRDKDGIPDKEDACPRIAGDSSAHGCPDSDGDGVADKDDGCPSIAGSIDNKGCPPPDRDGDGISDSEDHCPDTAGLAKYQGCPIPDSDRDGINDEEDHCPHSAGTADNGGCPLPDRDKDGIPDDKDSCPSLPGNADNHGCPIIDKAIISRVNNAAKRVQFNYNSTTLTTASKKVLREVVKILKSYPELRVFIEGYTSSDGNPKNHLRLSTARANAVKQYLESQGIDASRLRAEGFGAANPLNSERTEYLRSLNRRVELKITNH